MLLRGNAKGQWVHDDGSEYVWPTSRRPAFEGDTYDTAAAAAPVEPKVESKEEKKRVPAAYKMSDLRDCLARKPDPEQQACLKRIEPKLHARRAEVVGNDILAARRKMAEIILAEVGGGSETKDVQIMQYLLGVRAEAPMSQVGGMGTLRLTDDGEILGRPGFVPSLFSAEETKGGPGRALRHITAWHTIRAFLNRVAGEHGVEALTEVYDEIYDRVDRRVGSAAEDWLRAAGITSKTEHRVLWVAIVMNNERTNLWPGGGKENTSINSFSAWLKRWTMDLDQKKISVAQLEKKVKESTVDSRKGREVKARALEIIAAAEKGAADRKETKDGVVTRIVSEMYTECIRRLEVDVRDERDLEGGWHHYELFRLANQIGALGEHLGLIEAFLDLAPRGRSRLRSLDSAADRRRDRSASPRRSRSPELLRDRSASPRRSRSPDSGDSRPREGRGDFKGEG